MPAPVAIDAFVRHITEARARLDVLQGFLGDHMGVDPDGVNWGHVGTAAAANGALIELMETLGIDPENIAAD